MRELEIRDVSQDYCSWMNDPEVTKYLEIRLQKWTIKELENYVREIKKRPDILFWTILLKDKNQHIGNIKLGHINGINGFADIGIIIGEKAFWGKGFATEAIKLVVDYAFNKLNLQKLIAGANKSNISSVKIFQKAGFSELRTRKNPPFNDDKYKDSVLLGIVRK